MVEVLQYEAEDGSCPFADWFDHLDTMAALKSAGGKGDREMALTRSFKETVKARADRDPAFRVGLLQEALEAFLDGDLATGKALLRDYVNATGGFEEIGSHLHKSPKSLMRMLSEEGNPRADNLFALVAHLKTAEGVSLSVTSKPARYGQTHWPC